MLYLWCIIYLVVLIHVALCNFWLSFCIIIQTETINNWICTNFKRWERERERDPKLCAVCEICILPKFCAVCVQSLVWKFSQLQFNMLITMLPHWNYSEMTCWSMLGRSYAYRQAAVAVFFISFMTFIFVWGLTVLSIVQIVWWYVDYWIMYWKECVRKWLWPNLRYSCSISLEGLRKTTITCRGCQSVGWGFTWALEFEATMLPIQMQCSVNSFLWSKGPQESYDNQSFIDQVMWCWVSWQISMMIKNKHGHEWGTSL
jgi:hypothetical protein